MATKTKKVTTPKVKRAQSKKTSNLSHDEIARQAYMLWLERGGGQLDNWLEAERQLR